MEKEAFSASILRYKTSDYIKMTIMKRVNQNMENSKKMVPSNRAWPDKVKKAFFESTSIKVMDR